VTVRTWITTEPLDPAQVLASVGAPEDGALLLFLGIVREENEGRRVVSIRYDAYVAMAERVLAEVAREAAGRLGTERIAVVHRIGELGVGEASVAIAVSSPHRAEAFDACRYIIEEIKRRLPIWKEERYVDGEARWLAGSVPPVPASGGGAS
jgi:molybdopterin synthase catalytic subunit